MFYNYSHLYSKNKDEFCKTFNKFTQKELKIVWLENT